MKARTAIGHTIYAKRRDLGMTATELSRLSGVSNAYISQVEHGKREVSSEYLALFAAGLGVTAGWILAESGRLMDEWEGYLTSPDLERTVGV